MSPAGYWPQLRAAIEAGADSVYFGLKHFTARAKVGFAVEELPEVFRTLHSRGVKGFVTFNTLVFEHEIEEAARAIAVIAQSGADALIVQDVGILQLAHEIAPDLELHASTQMSITNSAGVRLARQMGASRITLARELSLGEIRTIREQTDAELEIFVHGALCVAYSGQCFSSEAWGGRSANRGQCAQACRMEYELIVDGEPRPLDDARYLLSPGDLYALHHVPEMVDIGISALKIEGRYKDADYVALTTRAYRKAVDDAWAGRSLQITAAEELQVEQVYSRGLGDHFLSGTNHQRVVEGRAPRHRGVLLGRVTKVVSDAAVIEASDAHGVAPLKPGDGVVFDAASWRSPTEREEGGRLYAVSQQRDGTLIVRFGNRAVDFTRIRPGDLLWRTHDPDLDKVVRPFLEATTPVAKQPLRVKVVAREGFPLETRWSLTRQPESEVSVASSAPLGSATNRILDIEFLRDQLGRLGTSAYVLDEIDV
jgi:putative protease